MILRWLTQVLQWLGQYPASFLFCIIGGIFGLVGNGARMLSTLDKQTVGEGLTYAVGMVFGAGLAGSYALRVMPQHKHLADVLGHIGAISGIIYPFLLLNNRRMKLADRKAQSQSTAPSDDIWPPPPTAPSGG